MTQPKHSKIINKTAKKHFNAHQIKQKGQSRIWLDDNGWFTTVIEFQPFHGRLGTTLNIGVNFNWQEQDFFSFDIGYRQNVNFIEYKENDEKFELEVEKFCEIALNKALEYRKKLEHIDKAKSFILNYTFASENIWGSYHKAIICGLTSDYSLAKKYHQKLSKENDIGEWLNKLKNQMNLLINHVDDKEIFTENVIEIIRKTRILKKLSEREIKLF